MQFVFSRWFVQSALLSPNSPSAALYKVDVGGEFNTFQLSYSLSISHRRLISLFILSHKMSRRRILFSSCEFVPSILQWQWVSTHTQSSAVSRFSWTAAMLNSTQSPSAHSFNMWRNPWASQPVTNANVCATFRKTLESGNLLAAKKEGKKTPQWQNDRFHGDCSKILGLIPHLKKYGPLTSINSSLKKSYLSALCWRRRRRRVPLSGPLSHRR